MPDLRLPSPRVSLLLVLVFLGFGWVIGDVVGTPRPSALVPTRFVLAQTAPTATQAAPSASLPPTPEPTSTPSPSSNERRHASSDSGHPADGPASSARSGTASAKGSAGGTAETRRGASKPTSTLPAVKHVFLIVLADQPYASLFGPSSGSHYLSKTLERQGELLVRYYAVAHDQLANGIALISGQGPTVETAVDCPTYADIAPATVGADRQVLGHGCVYPRATETLGGQLAAKHLTWRAYVEDMSPSGAGQSGCSHPALGAADPAVDGALYRTARNPFMYFHSVIDGPACATQDVGLELLAPDLASERRTPSLAYIVPSAGGVAGADAFLRKVVPEILRSKAYKHGGLLAITADQAPATGLQADSSSCCGQPRYPALGAPAPLPGGGQLPPSGGGQVGALLLSPFVKPGSVNQDPYNHFALLRTIEDLFGLQHLGYAAGSGVNSFGASVFGGDHAG